MPIHPLPQFEADLKEHLAAEDKAVYDALRPPKTIVVRFGRMYLVGEFPYSGSEKPGCGSKLVVRTWRGTEMGEMLTSTCPNSGCSKSVSRKEMLSYIQNSGGRDYPFFTDGRVLRIATKADMDEQARLEQSAHALRLEARSIVEALRLPMRIVEAEPILGQETLTFFYLSEDRVDLGELHRELSRRHRSLVELRQVGSRDEARLTADYEKCGQYCCCKNFLKVLKPISMKSAKIQKATLDPLKISGRCGRLMCCLRYEDETYESLRKRLPRKKSRVGTPEGDGTVMDSQILTQLVLVLLDIPEPDGKPRQVAVPVESLTEPQSKTPPPPQAPPPPRGVGPRQGGPAGPPSAAPRGTGADARRPRRESAPDEPPVAPPAHGQRQRPESAGRPPEQRPPEQRGRPVPPGRPPENRDRPRGPGQEERRRPPAPPPPAARESDDFADAELDELLDEGPEDSLAPEGAAGDDADQNPNRPQGDASQSGPRRRRKRRRRRGRGGPPGPGGPPGQGGEPPISNPPA